MKNDFLSDALRRGDPTEEQPETESYEARKVMLLSRCAAEPFTEPARLPFTRNKIRPGKRAGHFPRWRARVH